MDTPSSPLVEGCLEHYDRDSAIGWVWAPSSPATRLAVELLADGVPVAAGIANIPRDDVAAMGHGDGRCGFQIPLWLPAGQRLRVRVANTALHLPGEITVARPPSATGGGEVHPFGGIDRFVGLRIDGWCWHPQRPGAVLGVQALLDRTIVASATADRFRPDLAAGGIGSGRHAFELRLPAWLGDGNLRSVTIRTDEGLSLPGSPLAVASFADGPDALLDGLKRSLAPSLPPEAERALALLGLHLAQTERLLPRSLPWHDYERWRQVCGPSAPSPTEAPPEPPGGGAPPPLVLLDQGAELLPGALDRALRAFAESGADVLYADAEVQTGDDLVPWFRPGWSYDLFLAQDYTRGLFLLRSGLVESGSIPTGPDLSEVERAEVKMRAVEAARPDRILRLPEVLTRLTGGPPDGRAWLSVIDRHLTRRGLQAQVEATDPRATRRRVRWPVPDPPPLISLIIPTRDRLDLLKPCIESIRCRTTYPAYEIIVVNNQSRDAETLHYLSAGAREGLFRVVDYDKPFNFSDMNNAAVRVARGAMLGFINNDIELITPHWLEEMAGHLARPEVGVVGAKLRFPNGMIQHGGVVLGVGGLAENAFQHLHVDDDGYFHRTQVAGNYSAVTGACLFCRTDVFTAVGGYDAANLPVAFNDVDLCLRIRERGWSIVWTPHVDLFHHESVSRGPDESPDRRARAGKEEAYMRHRWHRLLLHDPYYNPNLNLDHRPFTGLALPPRHRWGAPPSAFWS